MCLLNNMVAVLCAYLLFPANGGNSVHCSIADSLLAVVLACFANKLVARERQLCESESEQREDRGAPVAMNSRL